MPAITDFQDNEIIVLSAPPATGQKNAIVLNLPLGLTDRRIYAYAEMKLTASATPFFLVCEIVIYKGGEIIAKYPLEIGQNIALNTTNIPRTLRCLANAGGSPVGDCLTLVLWNAFSAFTLSAIVQPIRLAAEADKAVLNIIDASGAANIGYRLYLGILSQN